MYKAVKFPKKVVDGQAYLIQQSTGRLVVLNPVSLFIYRKLLGKAMSYEDLLKAILKEYDVEKSQAENDLKEFLKVVVSAGVVKEES